MTENQVDTGKKKENAGLPYHLFHPSMKFAGQIPVHQIHIITGTRI